ncbi:GNAT family N-acetyltransferase [Tessaracoccus sp. Z1128]
MPADDDALRDLVHSPLRTHRLRLTPLTVDDAAAMAEVLADPSIHRYTGDSPPTVEELQRRYRAQGTGPPPPSTEVWGNWAVRLPVGAAIGFAQATVDPPASTATLAWVIGAPHQGNGYATEAMRELVSGLRRAGIRRLVAFVHPRNVASRRVAQKLGLAMPAPHRAFDGEDEWVWDADAPLPMTDRLVFRRMDDGDLDSMAALLGDPSVMRYYPHPKTRDEAVEWIDWNRRNYARDGLGLWIIATPDGDFVGDCGLTWQLIDGREELEVGYHVLPRHQGRGLATDAAAACRDLARSLGHRRLIAIIHPDNVASQRVAEKTGLALDRETISRTGARVRVYAADL